MAIGAPMRQRYVRMVELGNEGSATVGTCGRGRAVALELRHAAGCVCEGTRTGLWEQLRPLYFVAARVDVRGQLRRKNMECAGAGARTDSGASAGKYLEPGVEQCLFAHGFAEASREL